MIPSVRCIVKVLRQQNTTRPSHPQITQYWYTILTAAPHTVLTFSSGLSHLYQRNNNNSTATSQFIQDCYPVCFVHSDFFMQDASNQKFQFSSRKQWKVCPTINFHQLSVIPVHYHYIHQSTCCLSILCLCSLSAGAHTRKHFIIHCTIKRKELSFQPLQRSGAPSHVCLGFHFSIKTTEIGPRSDLKCLSLKNYTNPFYTTDL